jgi:hypothetical protein
MIPMSIMTLHQNDVTIESLQLLACWKYVSQAKNRFMSESPESLGSPLVLRTKSSFILDRKRSNLHNGHCDVFFSFLFLCCQFCISEAGAPLISVLFAPVDRIARRTDC